MSWYDIISKRFIEKNNQRSLDYLIYSGDTKITVEKFRKSFKKLLQFNSKKVLEIGCGTGAVLYLFYKNGSRISSKYDFASVNNSDTADGIFRGFSLGHTITVNLSASDYIEVYTYMTASTGSPIVDEASIFGGYKLIT